MTMLRKISLLDDQRFQNLSEQGLELNDVCTRVMDFMSADPKAGYHFVIGTDSQVHRGQTKFVTGVIIHRVGRGAWACYRQLALPREIASLREKLVLETTFSQRVAEYFALSTLGRMEEIVLPYLYQGALLETYIDIDAGTEPVVNKSSLYVQEMVDRVEASGLYAPRVKPEAYAASAYANRFTKKPIRNVI
ncbi:hypothetical protein EBB07_34255 [Paenibacillaceae bacterium]|nr:hypothetical protein EBB07_34255 [Paenibacillaceae bacterium]